MSEFQRLVADLKIAIERARKEDIVLSERIQASFKDFKGQQRERTRTAVLTSLKLVEKEALKAQDPAISKLMTQLNETQDLVKLDLLADELLGLAASEDSQKSFIPKKPKVPSDIRDDVNADLDEIERCMKSQCYRSAVILCGRLLETALHRKYYEVTKNDLLEKSPGIGLGNLVAKLADNNVKLDPALGNQIHLINQIRIHSVHQKQNAFRPSAIQAQAIVLYTTDVLDKLFA